MSYRLNAKFTNWQPQSAEDFEAVKTLNMPVYNEDGKQVPSRVEGQMSAYEAFNPMRRRALKKQEKKKANKKENKQQNKQENKQAIKPTTTTANIHKPPISGAVVANKKSKSKSKSKSTDSPWKDEMENRQNVSEPETVDRHKLVAPCPIGACGNLAVQRSELLAHLLGHRLQSRPIVAYADSQALKMRLDLQDIWQAGGSVCLSIMLYGGRDRLDDPCQFSTTINQSLPSAYSRYKTYLPLLLMAGCSNWSNYYGPTDAKPPADDSVLCLWVVSGDTFFKLQCTLTVYGLGESCKTVSQMLPIQNIFDGFTEFLTDKSFGAANVLYLNSGNVNSLLGDRDTTSVDLEVFLHETS